MSVGDGEEVLIHAIPLCKVWLRSKCASNRPQVWLEEHKREWQLLLPVDDTKKVMDAGPDVVWSDYSKEVTRIVESSGLGKHLFSYIVAQISETLVRQCMERHLVTLKQKEHLSETDVLETRNAIKVEVAAIPCVGELTDRREITVTYRGWSVKMWTRSVEEQIAMTVFSAVRGWLSELELIPALPGEAVLTKPDGEMKVLTADSILCRDAKASRKHLLAVLKASEVKEGALVKAAGRK
eukprot:6491674-Amphidinium_carterae.2